MNMLRSIMLEIWNTFFKTTDETTEDDLNGRGCWNCKYRFDEFDSAPCNKCDIGSEWELDVPE